MACLLGGRIQVELTWTNDPPNPLTPPTWPAGGVGTVGLLHPSSSPSTAVFYLHDPETLEVIVKVIDGGPVNGKLWIFGNALTDVGFDLVVTDTASGATKTYSQPQGVVTGAIIDTGAFAASIAAPSAARSRAARVPTAAAATACGPTTMCLHGGRFEATVDWRNQYSVGSSDTGVGTVVPYSDAAGLFWFFHPANLELLVDVLDGRPWNGHFWVQAGGLTDVEWELRILDTSDGSSWTYRNLPGATEPFFDQKAFPPPLEVEARTAGEDADAATGPVLLADEPVTWTYLVTNLSADPLSQVQVVDDQGVAVSCPSTSLAGGASTTCTASGIVAPGQYRNEAVASAQLGGAALGSAPEASHHFGATLALVLEARVEGDDADAPPGPEVPAGSTLLWTFTVTNGSNLPLVVALSDDGGLAPDCPLSELAPGEGMECSAASAAAAGPVRHLATALGTAAGGVTVTAEDETHYEGLDAEKIPTLGGVGAGLLALLLLAGGLYALSRTG